MKHFFPLILAIMAVTLPVSSQQFIPVKGIVNARDLGGYTTPGESAVRSNLLLRAASLADATEADLQYLASLPVAKVIDFRKEEEKQGKADRFIAGAEYITLPIDASGNAAAQATEKEKKKLTGRKKFDVKKIIVMIAFNEKAQKWPVRCIPHCFSIPSANASTPLSSARCLTRRAVPCSTTARRAKTAPA